MQNLHLILILLALVERALLNDLVEAKDSDEKPTTICKLFIFFSSCYEFLILNGRDFKVLGKVQRVKTLN